MLCIRDLKPQCFWSILRHSFLVLGKLRQMFKKVLLSIDGGKKDKKCIFYMSRLFLFNKMKKSIS